MNTMEMVLLILGILIFMISFFIPDKSREQEEIDVNLEAIRKMVDERVEAARGRLNEIVDESVQYAVEKSERSMERVSNDKIMAVGEYSEAVLAEIDRNHQEVVFLYDMMTEKSVDLKNSVREADQIHRDIKAALRQTREISVTSLTAASNADGAGQATPQAAPSKTAETEPAGRYSRFDQIPTPSFPQGGFQGIPGGVYTERRSSRVVASEEAQADDSYSDRADSGKADDRAVPSDMDELYSAIREGASPMVDTISQDPIADLAAQRVSQDQKSQEEFVHGFTGIAPSVEADTQRILKKAGREPLASMGETPQAAAAQMVSERDVDIQFGAMDNSSANKNERILMLHRSGKSNVEIARTLNLGMGEVKLVIDLFEGAKS